MDGLSEIKRHLIEDDLEGKKKKKEEGKWREYTEEDQEREGRRLMELYRAPVCYTMPMEGVHVSLPEGLVPYVTQKRMMLKIIQALRNPGQNALIESPTGSGKTMALLAAVCGWLKHYKQLRLKTRGECLVHVQPREGEESEEWDEEREGMEMRNEVSAEAVIPKPECTCLEKVQIFYASRTHSQLDQVIEEFARLDHAPAMKHTILASKSRMCINQSALSGDVNETCKRLNAVSESCCEFKKNMRIAAFESVENIRNLLEKKGVDAWNIAQLRSGCGEGQSSNPRQLCPYYVAKKFSQEDADIVFCPFNYLMDPNIRVVSNINLRNAVVILDEAHNVEDNCRESASFEFREKTVFAAVMDLEEKKSKVVDKMRILSDIPENQGYQAKLNAFLRDLQVVLSFVRKLYGCMREISEEVKGGGTITKRAEELWEIMGKNGLILYPASDERVKLMIAMGKVMLKEGEDNKYPMMDFRPSMSSIDCLRSFDLFMIYLTSGEEGMNRNMYRLNVNVSVERKKSENPIVVVNTQGRKKKFEPIWSDKHVAINFWCMSAKLAFTDSFGSCRNVILASGTLCPIQPLIQELGTKFDEKFRHDGEQVVPSDQIFAAALRKGPNGISLRANRDNLLRPEFQLEIGLVIKSACEVVPGGVLVFVSSYTALEKIYKKMEDSGMLEDVSRFKRIVIEKKKVTEFEQTSKDFEEGIKNPKKFGSKCTGSLMFAVFRGKVSEGIDFKDDRARCVISVGIPLPNLGDEKVKAKREYNDMNTMNQGIPTGDEWYQAQAYRALNQAVGRCLRHRGDWGAIVMVDERLAVTRHATTRNGEKSAAQVSGWIRNLQRNYAQYDHFEKDLRGFVDKMKAKFG